MSRNYGLGSRNMMDAVRLLLKWESLKGNISFSSAGTITERFSRFEKYMRAKGIGRLERVSEKHVIDYGYLLASKVEQEVLSAAYSQNLVSALNTVFNMLRNDWEDISPTQDCGISKRCLVRKKPTLSNDLAESAIQELHTKHYEVAWVAELALHFGLRSKEASLFDSKAAYVTAYKQGIVLIEKGTKGGRKRHLDSLSSRQIKLLGRASHNQSERRSLMPESDSWKTWRDNGLRQGREVLHKYGIKGFHEFRALYAANRYKAITGWDAPVNGGVVVDKELDMKARGIIAKELGHNRTEIASAYIGGRA